VRAHYPPHYTHLHIYKHTHIHTQVQDPVSAIVEMMSDLSIVSAQHLQFDSKPWDGRYGELTTGSMWPDAERRSGVKLRGGHMAPILMAKDGVSVGFSQNRSVCPFVVMCGNLVGGVTRAHLGKRVIAYSPVYEVNNFKSRPF
jgi:hypothetical protein